MQVVCENRNVQNKFPHSGINMDESYTSAFNVGKFFGFPVLFSDPAIDSLSGHAKAFSRLFSGRNLFIHYLLSRIPKRCNKPVIPSRTRKEVNCFYSDEVISLASVMSSAASDASLAGVDVSVW